MLAFLPAPPRPGSYMSSWQHVPVPGLERRFRVYTACLTDFGGQMLASVKTHRYCGSQRLVGTMHPLQHRAPLLKPNNGSSSSNVCST